MCLAFRKRLCVLCNNTGRSKFTFRVMEFTYFTLIGSSDLLIHIGFTQHKKNDTTTSIHQIFVLRAYFLRAMETAACKAERKRMFCDWQINTALTSNCTTELISPIPQQLSAITVSLKVMSIQYLLSKNDFAFPPSPPPENEPTFSV